MSSEILFVIEQKKPIDEIGFFISLFYFH